MLKAEPLTVDEVNKYGGVGTENNHVNMYVYPTNSDYQTADNLNGYGGMAYYTSSMCGYGADGNYSTDGCITDYAQSEVKYVVDAWSLDKFTNGVLVEDETGYSARLLTFEDLINNFGYVRDEGSTHARYIITENTPSWVYDSSYSHLTMSQHEDSASLVWFMTPEAVWISLALPTTALSAL